MRTEGTTRLSRTFCSARDRNIPVLVRENCPTPSELSPGHAPELVSCLDYGVRCSGWLCPLFSVPTLPPEELLEEAIQAERARKERTIAEGRAILKRALREGRDRREEEAPRRAARHRWKVRDLPPDPPSTY